jgi:SHS2 domain-containing protein
MATVKEPFSRITEKASPQTVQRVLGKVLHLLNVEEAVLDVTDDANTTLYVDPTKKQKGRPKAVKAATPHTSSFKRKKHHTELRGTIRASGRKRRIPFKLDEDA